MKRLALILYFFIGGFVTLFGQTNGYFIQFTDKDHSSYSIDKPEEFLSARSIQRRERQNISITEEDLPVSDFYIDSLKNLKIDVRYTTKWLNGAIVFSADNELMDTLLNVSFVSYVEMTKKGEYPSFIKKFEEGHPLIKKTTSVEYGLAWDQIRTINGHLLHEKGFKGEGMQIAVIDAGFNSAESLPSFQHLWNEGRILGTKDFVNPQSNIFEEHYHGMKVLSIMGGEITGTYRGTAPDASYWLLRTEDAYSETPIEPDYWVCSAEFADSVGVDIINSSLGYYEFDAPFTSYTYENLDGTSRASKAAEIAASKGMVVVVSAGNEGNNSWYYIGVPADAKNIISVAAMNADSIRASFSSYGPSYDQRVKPEVAAIGYATAVQSLGGGIELGNGTSYSSPVIAGMVACLWQALPDYKATEIVDLILEHSNQYNAPDDSFGYGIPDFNASVRTDVITINEDKADWYLSPNPFSDYIILKSNKPSSGIHNINLSIFDMVGNKVFSRSFAPSEIIRINDLSLLPEGLYILRFELGYERNHFKILKN